MIASIRGEVLQSGPGWVVIGVGGMGFRVEIPTRTPGAHIGLQLDLYTQLVVREDSLTLYGFSTTDELQVFGHLLGVSGVGPRSALGVLSELTPAQVAQAVATEDEKPFRQVSGIGPKTAKLIVVQLAGKIMPAAFSGSSGETEDAQGELHAVSAIVEQGLIGLGYSEDDAARAVRDAAEAGAPTDQAGLLRAALALLQPPRAGGRVSSDRGSRTALGGPAQPGGKARPNGTAQPGGEVA